MPIPPRLQRFLNGFPERNKIRERSAALIVVAAHRNEPAADPGRWTVSWIGTSVEHDNYARESKWPAQTNAHFPQRLTEATWFCEQLKIRTSSPPHRPHWSKKSRFARATQSDDRRQVLHFRQKIMAQHRHRVASQYFQPSVEHHERKDCPRSETCDQTAVAQFCSSAP